MNTSDKDVINGIITTLRNDFYKSKSRLTKLEYDKFKLLLADKIKISNPNLNYVIEHLDQILDINIEIIGIDYDMLTNLTKVNFNHKFIKCEDRDEFYDLHRNNMSVINYKKLSTNQKKLFDQYEKLINLPQPAQKSKEWFDMRNNMLTASNGGAAIGESHYNTIKETILDKVGLGKKFKENKFVYHGKKYEKIAIMIYEMIYNTKIGEFGLIQHPIIKHLGASPDGISMSLTLDGQPNKLLGRMLEIKCPPSRVIQNKGKIKGDICPDYYWIQVQLQLECCDLPECDFWQCHLIEYKSESEFINDLVDTNVHSENQIKSQNELTIIENDPSKVYIDKRIRKGAIIELLPKDRSKIPSDERVEWYGKYIYPPTVLMSPTEYKKWTQDTIANLNTLYPELTSEYKFSKVVYWKLELSHNELITRQIDWFEQHKKQYKMFWDRVLYYRDHKDEAIEDLLNQRLSNEVFLLSESIKIPKIKSLSSFKKQNDSTNLEQNDSIFMKSNKASDSILSEHNSSDIFLSSSPTIPITSKTKIKTNTKTKSKNDDEFLNSTQITSKSKTKTKPKSKNDDFLTSSSEHQQTKPITKSKSKNDDFLTSSLEHLQTKPIEVDTKKEPNLLFKNCSNIQDDEEILVHVDGNRKQNKTKIKNKIC